MTGEWIALGLNKPTHYWAVDKEGIFNFLKRETECGIPMHKPDGKLRRPIYMRWLDVRGVVKWPNDPGAILPEYQLCLSCYAIEVGGPFQARPMVVGGEAG